VIGEVVGSYRVIAKLGAGGMGSVWLAEHQLLGSRAAIKVLLPDFSKQDKIVQRFFDEARAATRIRDPGIVTVLDFGWHNGDAYLVMELLVGETLSQRLGHFTLPPHTAVRYIQFAGLAMAAAHARGIIHRDLKPDNLFIVADPAVPGGERIKILDFGIAKLLDRGSDTNHHSTVTGSIMGTPAYMSPEQCRGAGEIDHRTDIYALGCVLFQLLCGRPPFVAPTPGDMIASQLRQDPVAPSSVVADGTISPELDALVLRCLAKDPGARFATMTELVRAGAAITGDNHALDTIPPMRPSTELETDPTQMTAASLPNAILPRSLSPSSAGVIPAQPITTLTAGSLSADSTPPRSRPRGLLLLGGAALVAGVVAISFVVAHDSSSSRTPASGSGTADAAHAHAIDAIIPGPLDAARSDASLPDAPLAGIPLRDAGTRPRPRRLDAGPVADPDDDFTHR